MTVTDQIEILDGKIRSNRTQYDLCRKAAKISALSSKNLLDKYKYLTDVDLRYKPNVFEKTKFEYSKLGPNKLDISIYLNQTNGCNDSVSRNLLSTSFIKMQVYVGVNMVPMAGPDILCLT